VLISFLPEADVRPRVKAGGATTDIVMSGAARGQPIPLGVHHALLYG